MVKVVSLSRKLAIPAVGLALTASWFAVMAQVYSSTSTLPPIDHTVARTLFVPATLDHLNARQANLVAGLPHSLRAATSHEGTRAIMARPAVARGAEPTTSTASATGPRHVSKKPADRFDAVVQAASLSPQKIALAFASRADAVSSIPVAGSNPSDERFDALAQASGVTALPSADRFGPAASDVSADAGYQLALALPISTIDRAEPPTVETAPEELAATAPLDQMAALPIPDDVPLPSRRPADRQKADEADQRQAAEKKLDDVDVAQKPADMPKAQKPNDKPLARKPAPTSQIAAAEPAQRGVLRSTRDSSAPTALAYAAPDDGGGSVGKAFKNLFNTGPAAGLAGKRVAVYNISAKTVTMPDGTVLKAYSGIGEMANNPKYVHVKMRGPTPPDTYKLKMRESRFHGVEAIRMLPVDGKNKLGRNGILAHSQLLRGRKGQSHGCVAFEDYDKFLNAFKKGKVTHMVVIPGNGRGSPAPSNTRVASNGDRG